MKMHKVCLLAFALIPTLGLLRAQTSDVTEIEIIDIDTTATETEASAEPMPETETSVTTTTAEGVFTAPDTPLPPPPPPPPPTAQASPVFDMNLTGGTASVIEFPTDSSGINDAESTTDVISVDFPEEEVRKIISDVAEFYDLNVIIPDTLQGSTTIKLNNVTWQQIFDAVLDPLGYTYVTDRNIIKIRSRLDVETEPTQTQIFMVNYAVADQLRAAIAPLVDTAAGGRLQVDKRTNALVITERPSQLNQITQVIDRLDRATAQVMIESKFIQVDNSDVKNLGVDWSSLGGYQIGVGGLQRTFNQGYTQTREDTRERGLEVDNETTDLDTTGFDLATGPIARNEDTTDFETTVTSNDTDVVSNVFNLSRTTSAVFSADDFNIILSALQTYADSRVVNNPTIVTLDGEQAKIVIGEKYPIPDYTYNDDRGTFEVSGFKFEDIGIVLSVRPQVNSAGFIRLDIAPEISRRSAEAVDFGGAAQAIPIIETTETVSSVTLKDGHTLAIGGLMQREETNRATAVPFVSDVPVLGELFESDSDNMRETNLIIFVTAKTLNPDGTTYREIVDPRMLARMSILESDIPGYHFDMPEDQLDRMSEIDALRNRADREKILNKYRQELELLELAEQRRDEARRAELEAEEEEKSGQIDKSKLPVSRAR